MKELDLHNKIGVQRSNTIELNIKKQKEIEYQLIGDIIPQRGHSLFEVNTVTREVKEAQYKPSDVNYVTLHEAVVKKPKELIINANCVYIPALNANNALKKYDKNPAQSFYYKKEAPLNLGDLKYS